MQGQYADRASIGTGRNAQNPVPYLRAGNRAHFLRVLTRGRSMVVEPLTRLQPRSARAAPNSAEPGSPTIR